MASKAKKKAPAKKAPAKKAAPAVVDTEARAALVSLGKVLVELYPGMPSGVDEGYHDFLAAVGEFDHGS